MIQNLEHQRNETEPELKVEVLTQESDQSMVSALIQKSSAL